MVKGKSERRRPVCLKIAEPYPVFCKDSANPVLARRRFRQERFACRSGDGLLPYGLVPAKGPGAALPFSAELGFRGGGAVRGVASRAVLLGEARSYVKASVPGRRML